MECILDLASHCTASRAGRLSFSEGIQVSATPEHYPVHVSADHRFILYVNGVRVGEGPARGDLLHWRYESFDLASFLHLGKNVVAAIVWNWGIYGPLAQITDRTAFLMQGDGAAEAQANTDKSWQVSPDPGYEFITRTANGLWDYWAADPGERIRGSSRNWTSSSEDFSPAASWVSACTPMREIIHPGASMATSSQHLGNSQWGLVPDTLPQMEYTSAPAGRAVRCSLECGQFPSETIAIAAHTTAKILLDCGRMVTGYPRLAVSGGLNAKLPQSVAGSFVWKGQTPLLHEGQQSFSLENSSK